MIDLKVKYLLSSPKYPEYFNLYKYVTPSNKMGTYEGKKFWDLTFSDVITLKRVSDDVYRIFKIVFGIEENALNNMKSSQFLPAYYWVKEEYRKLEEREKKLEIEPDERLIKAGIEEFNVLKEKNICIQIGKDFGFKPNDILAWEYGEVYAIQLHETISNSVNRRLANDTRTS